jgi:hypothetical protein
LMIGEPTGFSNLTESVAMLGSSIRILNNETNRGLDWLLGGESF